MPDSELESLEQLTVSVWGNGEAISRLPWTPKGTNLAQVTCGSTFFAVLTENGAIWTWGTSKGGALCQGNGVTHSDHPNPVMIDQKIAFIHAAGEALALITESNQLNLCGSLSGTPNFLPKPITWEYEGTLLSVTLSSSFALAITESRVRIWLLV